ncbi:GAF domain-containing sensor histidine kinase [Mucilaginibacter gilvus]|uniref:GAF domain-containing sensor histidine kinase n=1 Tax=Mucilaginibacter gilvus TaxID=2305909 RepID=UPI001419D8F0|nr:GAF domain-containing sensor histidine kinase [Mucilaginibacter gilvus]
MHSYQILDSGTEKDYDDLTALAAAICQAPIAVISMVDEKRQWFKSHHGIDTTETPIEHSFCTHAINAPNYVLIVPDAKSDARFSNNPLVNGQPHIIFYAGVALVNSEGFALGSLCVVDHKSRNISAEQLTALTVIAKQIMDKLELRRKILQLQDTKMELETSFNALKASEDERKDFIVNISHDIRTPLAVAKGYIETLLLKEELSPEFHEYLHLIDHKAQLVENLVSQLFELSKMESVAFKAQREPFSVAEVLKEIVQSWKLPAQNKNIKLDCTGCEDVSMIFADISLMERLIQNLIGNALKFTPEHGYIHITFFQNGDELVMQFMNNGPAIPPAVIAWVMQDKKQRGIIKRPYKSGLGLAIVKRIAELHGFAFTIDTTGHNKLALKMPIYRLSH